VEKRKTKKYSPCVASPAGKPTGEAYGSADQSMKKPILVSLILSNNRLKALMLEKSKSKNGCVQKYRKTVRGISRVGLEEQKEGYGGKDLQTAPIVGRK